MDAHDIEPGEVVPASRKLGRDDAVGIVASSTQLFVAKGKKLTEFSPKTADTDEIVAAMLGPTGNLRAPTIRCGETVLVGFNLGAYERVLG
jgi:hypothetical protein